MKADIVSFPKAPGQRGSDVYERGRLASKRDQQKWFPVLRLIARQTKIQRSAKVVSGFASDRAPDKDPAISKSVSGFASGRAPDKGPAISKSGFRFCSPRGWRCESLLRRLGWRIEAPRKGRA
ncbi:hypothetical protein [Mesorhizobium sp. CO1-1-8]|uniref:hypothetical protein n=1 Tax=Mesorhizobium sp. CO1-1-8 TaxID=2876631 RepID=UPI001CD0BC69|nr:hypothetical protein [Mesorhizobium sp. CO1-1-8]MBZ9771168.1 hypothetical protein [Mesorhizobium sp. CO1-1-8]